MITETIKNSLSPLAGTISNMSELDIQHKQDFERFVLAETNGSFRAFVGELYCKWHDYNRDYFGNKLIIPTYLTLSNTRTTSRWGEYSSVSSWGGTSEIRIKPTLFTGKHPSINASAPMEGRKRLLFDILLHEVVHQYSHEILGIWEDSFHGHGPVFRDECNRISVILGITQKVRTSKKRGKDKDLPSCAQWPHNVRPPDYYMGAWIQESDKTKVKPDPDPPEPPTEKKWTLDEIFKQAQTLDADERKRLGREIIVSTDERYHQLKAGQTRVAHYTKDYDLVQWAKNVGLYVYIGRAMNRYGLKASFWENPYKEKEYGRDEAIRLFREEHLPKNPEMLERIEELRGKLLVCWCYRERCHGDVLIELLTSTHSSDNPSRERGGEN